MGLIAAVLALAILGLHLASCLLVARRRFRLKPSKQAVASRITLLRPVRGVDGFDAETLASGFALDYPAVEHVFCVADDADPAAALVRGLIAAHPEAEARLLVGDDRIGTNPKLNNLAKGWDAATGDLVVMADANLLLPPDYLWRLLAVCGPDVGLVSCPPIGTRAEGVWGAMECAFLNSNQARLQLAADSLGLGFAQGKTMMWDRAFLNARGGLAPLGQKLVEDVAATQLVRAAGLRVALPVEPFAQPVGRRSLGQVWDRQLRWSKVRREGFPALFLLEPLNGAALPVLAAGLVGGPLAALALALVCYGAETALAWREGWVRRLWEPALFPLRDLMLWALWLASLRNTRFEWRGNTMAPGQLQGRPG